MQLLTYGSLAILGLVSCFFLRNYLNLRPQARAKANGSRLPPGPPGLPIVGNLSQLPEKHSWLLFKSWAEVYGPIFRFKVFNKMHVVLSTQKTADTLLRERGTIYSSREKLYFAGELLSHNLRPLFLEYNETWRRGRKLMHALAMQKVAASYEPAQSLESAKFIYDFLQAPHLYQTHLERLSAGIIFRLAFAKSVETGDESYVRRILGIVKALERVASPGAYLCDSVPALRYVPRLLAPFKKEAEKMHEEEITLFRGLQEDVQKQINAGRATDSFTKHFLENKETYGLSLDEGAYVIGTLFEAGSGTTAAALLSFFQCMVLHPEWQRRGQEEVDSVCGEKMPEFEDMQKLPLMRAIVKEVLRWRPVTAGGVPHKLTKDDVYEGLFLPAGTIVHANQWAIHRDPSLYLDPETFNPLRWLEPSSPTYREPLTIYPNLQSFSAFGFGRRVCPGMHIAERSLYIVCARILWAAKVWQTEDIGDYDYTPGFNTQPEPFAFGCSERNNRGKVVEEYWEVANESWEIPSC